MVAGWTPAVKTRIRPPNMAINPTAGAAARADKVRPRSPAAGYGRR